MHLHPAQPARVEQLLHPAQPDVVWPVPPTKPGQALRCFDLELTVMPRHGFHEVLSRL